MTTMNPAAARVALRDKIAATTTDTLVASLTALRASAPLDGAARMVQSMIVDVLTDRMPALLEAVDAWVDDDDSPFDTPADVVLDLLTSTTANNYVVTFACGPIAGPSVLIGLRRMSLADARALLTTAAEIPKAGRIVHTLTLSVINPSA